MQASYKVMFDAYTAIFNRFGLKFRAVAADNGAIGGTGSHEFHVIASTGEDAHRLLPDLRLRRQHGSGRSDAAGRRARRGRRRR